MRLYTVYDKVAEEFGPLFTAKNDDVAKRMCRSMIKSQSDLSSIDDLQLYLDCDFDTTTGRILATNEQRGTKDQSLPVMVCNFTDLFLEDKKNVEEEV